MITFIKKKTILVFKKWTFIEVLIFKFVSKIFFLDVDVQIIFIRIDYI